MSKKFFNMEDNPQHFQGPVHQPLKTFFEEKWKKVDVTSSHMNIGHPQRSHIVFKNVKKYSFQSKTNKNQSSKLIGSCGIIGRQKTVPKSKSISILLPKSLPLAPSKKTVIKVPKVKVQSQIKTYEWRSSTHFPVAKVACINSKDVIEQNSSASVYTQLQLELRWDQDIKFHLGSIDQFNLLNSLYILDESLVSFERLYNKFGFFEPTMKMIFITNGQKCKIWANQNIWLNTPVPPKFVSRQHQKVQYFYKKVIKIFSNYFHSKAPKQVQHDNMRKSVNLIQKLIYELQRKTDFVQGLKFINEFLNVYSLKINSKFLYPVENPGHLSRIFSTKAQIQHHFKINTLGDIPITKKGSIQKEEKNIKTLKNSANHFKDHYKQVVQSNCKTIERKSQISKEMPTRQFKKQSQVSICSKQTIVEKKARFSLHGSQEKLQPAQKLLHMPNFADQDFIEVEQEVSNVNQTRNNQMQQDDSGFDPEKINDEEQYEERVRNEIEKNVRERNGWLQSPLLLLQGDDCAKSFQDSQPSVKVKNRQRALTKLNRIKKSIANSIVQ